MSINTYLADLAGNLVLSPMEKKRINASIENIRGSITDSFPDVREVKVFGSYGRGTILPRSSDEYSDVDLMVVFENEKNLPPKGFIEDLRGFVTKHSEKKVNGVNDSTNILQLGDIRYKLTPAYTLDMKEYFIPDEYSDWFQTRPDLFHQKLIQCNSKNRYRVKPLIRLLKHWNIRRNHSDISSYELESLVAGFYEKPSVNQKSYTECLKYAFDAIKEKTDYTRAVLARERIENAQTYEKIGDTYSALDEIKKAFPQV